VSQPEQRLPDVADVLVSTTASLVNLAGIRLTEKDHRNPAQAKEAIDAARQLLPLCPEEAVGPLKDALAQVQMLYVKERQQPEQPAEPGAASQQGTDEEAKARAEARSKIWTPPGS
jgi:hypothetical protein